LPAWFEDNMSYVARRGGGTPQKMQARVLVAQYYPAIAYANGQGVPQDYVRSTFRQRESTKMQ
jgi:TPR repeat protein